MILGLHVSVLCIDLVHVGLKMTHQSRNMQPQYHIICLILLLLCLTDLHPFQFNARIWNVFKVYVHLYLYLFVGSASWMVRDYLKLSNYRPLRNIHTTSLHGKLYQLCGENDIVKFCKLSRLRWAGHVIRQDDYDLSRRVLLSEPEGKRPRGTLRLGWEDGVEEDVARLGCRNWKIVALNREGSRKLLKEAEAHPGLQRLWREPSRNII